MHCRFRNAAKRAEPREISPVICISLVIVLVERGRGGNGPDERDNCEAGLMVFGKNEAAPTGWGRFKCIKSLLSEVETRDQVRDDLPPPRFLRGRGPAG